METIWPKPCTLCGRKITEAEWKTLDQVDHQTEGSVVVLELRNCSCGSTQALCLDPELLSMLAEINAQQAAGLNQKAA